MPTTPIEAFELTTGFTIGTDTVAFTIPTTAPTGPGGMTIEFSGMVGDVRVQESVTHAATITP